MLSTLVPLWAFLLLPVWIPVIAVTVGAIFDRFGAIGARSVTRAPHMPTAQPQSV